jgi:TM2 domain-containing membrane protein YozV
MLILCFVLGGLGVHRFYAGKTGTGILMFLTLGALGIWTFIDFIVIVTSNFSDKNGNKIRP